MRWVGGTQQSCPLTVMLPCKGSCPGLLSLCHLLCFPLGFTASLGSPLSSVTPRPGIDALWQGRHGSAEGVFSWLLPFYVLCCSRAFLCCHLSGHLTFKASLPQEPHPCPRTTQEILLPPRPGCLHSGPRDFWISSLCALFI